MEEKDRHDTGMARRRKVLGNAWVDKANAGKTAFNSEFQEFITRYAWGEIWTRPHFEERTRRVLVIGTMVALAALAGGCARGETARGRRSGTLRAWRCGWCWPTTASSCARA